MPNKNKLASPFENQLINENLGEGTNKKGDVVDHNVCPYFNHPREHSDGLSETFFTAVDGDCYHGPITEKAAKVSGPMGSSGEK